MKLILLIVAIVLFAVAAALTFQWFGTTDPQDAFGWTSLGLAVFAASFLPLPS